MCPVMSKTDLDKIQAALLAEGYTLTIGFSSIAECDPYAKWIATAIKGDNEFKLLLTFTQNKKVSIEAFSIVQHQILELSL
jgi:hypothetical protein